MRVCRNVHVVWRWHGARDGVSVATRLTMLEEESNSA
jgi:hypothetical protein